MRQRALRLGAVAFAATVVAGVPITGVRDGAIGALVAVAVADPAPPLPPPVPAPVPRPMPADPARVNPIGGARVSSTTPQGETAGLEAPLAAMAERTNPTVPMWAKDGIFAPTAHPNRQIRIHLPGELGLAPAAWTPDGGAVYASADVDYAARPFAGGGLDLVITRKTVFSASTIDFGVKLPPKTHLRQGVNVVLVETDAAPDSPSSVIGTFSIPVAHDRDGSAITVTPALGPGFPPGQSNLTIELGQANIFAFPVQITLAYRASDTPTSGALIPGWQGTTPGANLDVIPRPADYVTDPAGQHRPETVDFVVYAQRHSGTCNGGPNEYRAADGRSADFIPACLTHQMCLGTTPTQTSPDSCHNRLFANMSIQCAAAFGQTGADYDTCTQIASDEAAWVKANMAGGPG